MVELGEKPTSSRIPVTVERARVLCIVPVRGAHASPHEPCEFFSTTPGTLQGENCGPILGKGKSRVMAPVDHPRNDAYDESESCRADAATVTRSRSRCICSASLLLCSSSAAFQCLAVSTFFTPSPRFLPLQNSSRHARVRQADAR